MDQVLVGIRRWIGWGKNAELTRTYLYEKYVGRLATCSRTVILYLPVKICEHEMILHYKINFIHAQVYVS